jgi:predicted ribosomally synthesized peptide with SipW-like signal peptide
VKTMRETARALKRTFSIRSIIKVLAAVTAALFVGVIATGGTYALWNKSTTITGGTVKAGVATLVISSPLTMPSTLLYPGLTTYGTFVVTNSGDVPLQLTVQSLTGVASTSFSQSLAVAVAVDPAVSATVADCPSLGSYPWSQISSAPIAGSLGATLNSGASATLCVSTTLASTAATTAQGQAVRGFSLTIGGTQP